MSGLQYPYEEPQDIPLYDDPYGRPITWLFQSILKFGHVHLMVDSPLPRDMKVLISSHIAFCDKPKSPLDIQKYLELFPPTPNERRRVLPVQLLDTTTMYISGHLRDSIQSDQVIIVHHLGPLSWIIFLVFIPSRTIEQYTMGDLDPSLLNTLTGKLQDHINVVIGGNQFLANHRLHIPHSFQVNTIIMAFTIIHFLHQHCQYLDLSLATLMNFQCLHLKKIIKHHDKWLGNLHINGLSILAGSFVVHAKEETPEFPALWELGWAVIDVCGDGNCGFYVLMLGLQNNQDTTYSVYNRATATDWKSKTMQLRRFLQEQSRHLLSTEYDMDVRVIENLEFWLKFSVGYDDHHSIDSLTDSFVHPTLPDDLYFDNDDFRTNYTDYHMDAAWGPHVFSYAFRVRVVVVTRVTNYDIVPIQPKTKRVSKKPRKSRKPRTKTILRYSWDTRIYDFNKPLNHRVEIRDGIYRMPDNEYRRIPTIEILHHYGWIGIDKDGKAIDDKHHFQFLRRIIFDDVPIPPDPSSITLRQCLQSENIPMSPSQPDTSMGSMQRSIHQGPNTRSTQRKAMNIEKETHSNTNENLVTTKKNVAAHIRRHRPP
jgi:hypothetical protein